jgi:hypothetical protein
MLFCIRSAMLTSTATTNATATTTTTSNNNDNDDDLDDDDDDDDDDDEDDDDDDDDDNNNQQFPISITSTILIHANNADYCNRFNTSNFNGFNDLTDRLPISSLTKPTISMMSIVIII